MAGSRLAGARGRPSLGSPPGLGPANPRSRFCPACASPPLRCPGSCASWAPPAGKASPSPGSSTLEMRPIGLLGYRYLPLVSLLVALAEPGKMGSSGLRELQNASEESHSQHPARFPCQGICVCLRALLDYHPQQP